MYYLVKFRKHYTFKDTSKSPLEGSKAVVTHSVCPTIHLQPLEFLQMYNIAMPHSPLLLSYFSIWRNDQCSLFCGEGKVPRNHAILLNHGLGRFHTRSQSDLPATVAPGGMSVKFSDPYITDTKNNTRPTQQNTRAADSSPAPKMWQSILLRCMNEQIHKCTKWVKPVLPKLRLQPQSDLENMSPTVTLDWKSLGLHSVTNTNKGQTES